MSKKNQGKRRRAARSVRPAVVRLSVARPEAGRGLAALLKFHLDLSWSEARRLVRARQVRLAGVICPDPERRVSAGQHIEVRRPFTTKSTTPRRKQVRTTTIQGIAPTIRYADRQIVIVDKPAGLTTMRHAHEAAEFGQRARRYLPPTLEDLLPGLLSPTPGRGRRVLAVHRLDKDTSGLVIFARTPQAARHLGKQFREHTVERSYLALVRGQPKSGRIESHLVRDRGDGRRGSSQRPSEGQHAVTDVRVLEQFGSFALVECCLKTGRTHQVRIHLGEQGTPLCGERIYDRPLHGAPLPDASGATRPCLHAATLAVTHPATGQRLEWTAPLPPDMAELLHLWRRQSAELTGDAAPVGS